MIPLRVAPLARLPVTIGTMSFLFLGLFLLYPLWGVLSASFLTPDGATLTLDNYVRVLSRSFYRASVTNTLTIGLLATADDDASWPCRWPLPSRGSIFLASCC